MYWRRIYRDETLGCPSKSTRSLSVTFEEERRNGKLIVINYQQISTNNYLGINTSANIPACIVKEKSTETFAINLLI